MKTVFLLLGTNVGSKKLNLENAMAYIEEEIGPINRSSSIYKTKAWGNTMQSDFYNMALMVSTKLKPVECLNTILQIETKMGRQRSVRWAPRIIDIDILFFGSRILKTKTLTVPHPMLHNRRFTLVPLNELSPKKIHPVFHYTMATLLAKCGDELKVEKIN